MRLLEKTMNFALWSMAAKPQNRRGWLQSGLVKKKEKEDALEKPRTQARTLVGHGSFKSQSHVAGLQASLFKARLPAVFVVGRLQCWWAGVQEAQHFICRQMLGNLSRCDLWEIAWDTWDHCNQIEPWHVEPAQDVA
jgi:hypothetical protein